MGRLFNKTVRFILAKINGKSLRQELNQAKISSELYNLNVVPLARQAAAESIVLLKNDGVLPIRNGETVSVFGRCAIDYFSVGYGSGGDVIRPYVKNIIDGLRGAGVKLNEKLLGVYKAWLAKPNNAPDEGFWGHWPMCFPEMPLDGKLAAEAAKNSDLAIIVIGRAAGEDRENLLKKGSYYLTDIEKKMIAEVTKAFSRVAVVMDCGNMIDMNWVNEFPSLGAIVFAWQGGMEGGNAVADVLTGNVNPCGALPHTVSESYDNLPSAGNYGGVKFNNYAEDIYVGYRYFETFCKEKALYPFGFGLSYSTFDLSAFGEEKDGKISLTVTVENTGELKGKKIVQAYVSTPQGLLGKPVKELAAFAKTKELAPNETQTLMLQFDLSSFASYDDSGKTGNKSAFVLEKGDYRVFVGGDVRSAKHVFTHSLTHTVVTQQLSEALAVAPEHAFNRMINKGGVLSYEKVPTRTVPLKERILNNMPSPIGADDDKIYSFRDVKNGTCTVSRFVSQLSNKELEDLTHGEGKMNSPLGINGNAGAFGGISESLRNRGVPPIITCDGPSGIRIKRVCALLACGTALSSTFDTGLVSSLYGEIAAEMKHFGVDVLLAPGMNIQRNPLCGRNFEYYSEDPLLSGKMGAAVVNGLQNGGVSACPKHFACNNQERNRNRNDSRVSERALREIYLKGFEIMVKESKPDMLMTSYNKINGVWSHYNYELATTVLRGQWGYEGMLITDWWMQRAVSPEFPLISNDAYRVRAQVDVLMPGGNGFTKRTKVERTLLDSLGEAGGIQLAELQRTAVNVLNYVLKRKM